MPVFEAVVDWVVVAVEDTVDVTEVETVEVAVDVSVVVGDVCSQPWYSPVDAKVDAKSIISFNRSLSPPQFLQTMKPSKVQSNVPAVP